MLQRVNVPKQTMRAHDAKNLSLEKVIDGSTEVPLDVILGFVSQLAILGSKAHPCWRKPPMPSHLKQSEQSAHPGLLARTGDDRMWWIEGCRRLPVELESQLVNLRQHTHCQTLEAF